MSESNAELIAEARGAIDRSFHNSCQGRHADLLHRLADALEAAEKRAVEAEQELQVAEDQANTIAGDLAQAELERDALAAVVEKVREAASSQVERSSVLLADVIEYTERQMGPPAADWEHDPAKILQTVARIARGENVPDSSERG